MSGTVSRAGAIASRSTVAAHAAATVMIRPHAARPVKKITLRPLPVAMASLSVDERRPTTCSCVFLNSLRKEQAAIIALLYALSYTFVRLV